MPGTDTRSHRPRHINGSRHSSVRLIARSLTERDPKTSAKPVDVYPLERASEVELIQPQEFSKVPKQFDGLMQQANQKLLDNPEWAAEFYGSAFVVCALKRPDLVADLGAQALHGIQQATRKSIDAANAYEPIIERLKDEYEKAGGSDLAGALAAVYGSRAKLAQEILTSIENSPSSDTSFPNGLIASSAHDRSWAAYYFDTAAYLSRGLMRASSKKFAKQERERGVNLAIQGAKVLNKLEESIENVATVLTQGLEFAPDDVQVKRVAEVGIDLLKDDKELVVAFVDASMSKAEANTAKLFVAEYAAKNLEHFPREASELHHIATYLAINSQSGTAYLGDLHGEHFGWQADRAGVPARVEIDYQTPFAELVGEDLKEIPTTFFDQGF